MEDIKKTPNKPVEMKTTMSEKKNTLDKNKNISSTTEKRLVKLNTQ